MDYKKVAIASLLVLVIIFSGCVSSEKPKVYRVGVLCSVAELSEIFDAFKAKMAELGYVEGNNIVYDVYIAPLPVGNEGVIQKYVDEKVDMILSFATEATIETKAVAEGSGVPIVFTCTFIEGTAEPPVATDEAFSKAKGADIAFIHSFAQHDLPHHYDRWGDLGLASRGIMKLHVA